MKFFSKILFILFFIVASANIIAQERDFGKMLVEDVENINPVYMPVIGVGFGSLSFLGDIKNNTSNPLMGSSAIKVNVHAFIDGPKHYKFNIYAMMSLPGAMTVIQRDYLVPERNFRFQTDVFILGANAHYDFDHFIKKTAFVRPFIQET